MKPYEIQYLKFFSCYPFLIIWKAGPLTIWCAYTHAWTANLGPDVVRWSTLEPPLPFMGPWTVHLADTRSRIRANLDCRNSIPSSCLYSCVPSTLERQGISPPQRRIYNNKSLKPCNHFSIQRSRNLWSYFPVRGNYTSMISFPFIWE